MSEQTQTPPPQAPPAASPQPLQAAAAQAATDGARVGLPVGAPPPAVASPDAGPPAPAQDGAPAAPAAPEAPTAAPATPPEPPSDRIATLRDDPDVQRLIEARVKAETKRLQEEARAEAETASQRAKMGELERAQAELADARAQAEQRGQEARTAQANLEFYRALNGLPTRLRDENGITEFVRGQAATLIEKEGLSVAAAVHEVIRGYPWVAAPSAGARPPATTNPASAPQGQAQGAAPPQAATPSTSQAAAQALRGGHQAQYFQHQARPTEAPAQPASEVVDSTKLSRADYQRLLASKYGTSIPQ